MGAWSHIRASEARPLEGQLSDEAESQPALRRHVQGREGECPEVCVLRPGLPPGGGRGEGAGPRTPLPCPARAALLPHIHPRAGQVGSRAPQGPSSGLSSTTDSLDAAPGRVAVRGAASPSCWGPGGGAGRPCCLRVGRAGLRATSGRFPCATCTVSLPQGTWCLTLSLIKGDTFETKQFLWVATRSQHIPPLHNFLSRWRRCRGARGVRRRGGLLGPPPRRREGGAGRGEKPLRAA